MNAYWSTYYHISLWDVIENYCEDSFFSQNNCCKNCQLDAEVASWIQKLLIDTNPSIFGK